MKTLASLFAKAVVLATVLAVWAPRAAHAVGETNGRIAGTVTEAQTGAPVPGATVTASSSSLIGPPRTVTTGEDGRYEIVELPPGRYTVEVSYSGVKPITRKVIVRQGEMLPLDIAWSAELAETETTVVVEERHMTRPDTTQTGTVLSADTESKIASGRRYQDIVVQVAGTQDSGNVGNGNQAAGNPLIKGGLWTNNKWLVDGLDISDAMLNSFSSNINFDSIASVDVITGGMEAQYNTLGGIINLITAQGSDEWHVDSSFYVNNQKFSANPQFGQSLYSGVQDDARSRPAPTQSYQVNANVGGPILKHRLWFNFSFEYRYGESGTPSGPPLNVNNPSSRSNRYLLRLKLTWAPSDKHRFTLSASADPAFFYNVDNPNNRLATAQDYQDQGGIFTILQWDWFLNQNINTNVQAGFQYSFINFGPMGVFSTPDCQSTDKMFSPQAQCANYNQNTPAHTNTNDNSVWYNGSGAQRDKRYTVQFDPSVSLRGRLLGYHDAKIGIQTRYVAHTVDVKTPGDASFSDAGVDANGLPQNLEAGLCKPDPNNPGRFIGGCNLVFKSPPYSQKQQGFSFGIFAQDRWKPIKRLTILPGLRFDYGRTWNSIQQAVTSLYGFGPRLGATVDVTGDQKTIVSAFYGRSNEVMSLIPSGDEGDVSGLTQIYAYNPTSKRFDTLLGGFGGAGGYRIDPNASTPHSDEVTLGLRREVFRDSVASIDYTYKRLSNIWDGVEINQVWDPAGYRVVGFRDPTHPQAIYKVTTPDGNYREYQGVDFTVESRPSPNWDLYGAYTLAWTYGPGGEQFGQINFDQSFSPFYNPRITHMYEGFLTEDIRHSLKLRASYTYHGFSGGVFFRYDSGSPLTRKYYNYQNGAYTNQRGPTGTDPGLPPNGNPNPSGPSQTNDPRKFAEFRFPDSIDVSLRAQYDFHELIKQHLMLIVDFFNVFNLGAVAQIANTDNSQFGTVLGRQTPFRFQLGLRYVY